MLAAQAMSDIRNRLSPYIGKRVTLRANKGRKRIDEKKGILEKTYANLFVVRLQEGKRFLRVSYCYADLLTETVRMSIEIEGQEQRIGYVTAD